MKLLSTLGLIFALATPALAEDIYIEMLNKRDDGQKMVYGTDIARVEVGTTVTWIPTSKGHNVEFIAGPDGWDMPKKSKNGKEVSITFDQPGVYLYQCTPHKTMGMIALVVVGDGDNDVSGAKVRGKSKKKLAELLEAL
jgi:pseudoazurin